MPDHRLQTVSNRPQEAPAGEKRRAGGGSQLKADIKRQTLERNAGLPRADIRQRHQESKMPVYG